MESVVRVDNLCYRYREHLAVDHLSFDARAGEVLGLLGPNGAGKTTTVRLLNGLLEPASGQLSVMGYAPATQGCELRRYTGVLTETPALYERLTARQNLTFFGRWQAWISLILGCVSRNYYLSLACLHALKIGFRPTARG